MMGHYAPRLADLLMKTLFARHQQKDRSPARPRHDNVLNHPSGDFRERDDYQGHVSDSRHYTTASLQLCLRGLHSAVLVSRAKHSGWQKAAQNVRTAYIAPIKLGRDGGPSFVLCLNLDFYRRSIHLFSQASHENVEHHRT